MISDLFPGEVLTYLGLDCSEITPLSSCNVVAVQLYEVLVLAALWIKGERAGSRTFLLALELATPLGFPEPRYG